jgi:hypothetical protein
MRPRQLNLVWDVTGHDESQPLARLCGDVHRVGQFGFLVFQIGDLRAQCGLAGGQLFHLGALREVGANRAGNCQRQDAHHSCEDGGSAGGEPELLFALLINRRRDHPPDRLGKTVPD